MAKAKKSDNLSKDVGVDGSSEEQEARFNIETQYLKDLSYENADPLKMLPLQASGNQPEVDVGYDVHVDEKGGDLYEVLLRVRGSAKFGEADTAYVVEVVYGALTRLTNIPAEHKAALLFVSVPTLLFPYVRNLISDLSREGGYQSLLLNGLDFDRLYQSKLEHVRDQKQEQEIAPKK